MTKILKFFRSRFFLGALCILLEFVQLIAVFVLLYKFFLPITILGWVFHFAMLLYLINRDEIPEFKMPCKIYSVVVYGYRHFPAAAALLRHYHSSEQLLSAVQKYELISVGSVYSAASV